MNNCKTCKNLGCAMRGSDWTRNPAVECFGYEPISNADRIRAMSDYELADWLCKILTYCGNQHCNPGCPLFKCCNDQPTDNIEGWLKAPVDKGDDG